jgi:hypothetical protein
MKLSVPAPGVVVFIVFTLANEVQSLNMPSQADVPKLPYMVISVAVIL